MAKSTINQTQAARTKNGKPNRTIDKKKQTSYFPETKRSRNASKNYFKIAYPKVIGKTVNQRFRDLQTTDSFGADPVRPLESHAKLASEEEMIEQEVDALEKLIWVNLCSIARRTKEPQRLIWPLMTGLAFIVNEFIDATSEYEMGTLEDALGYLEFTTEGKVLFARSDG